MRRSPGHLLNHSGRVSGGWSTTVLRYPLKMSPGRSACRSKLRLCRVRSECREKLDAASVDVADERRDLFCARGEPILVPSCEKLARTLSTSFARMDWTGAVKAMSAMSNWSITLPARLRNRERTPVLLAGRVLRRSEKYLRIAFHTPCTTGRYQISICK
jgi:hypothetical protein